MHDDMQYDPIQGHGQGRKPRKSAIDHFQRLSPPPIYNGMIGACK